MARPTQFEWWDTHDRSWRRARWLFSSAAVVVALYVAGLASIVVVSLWAVLFGSAHDLEARLGDLGTVDIVVVACALLAVSTIAIVILGWRGLPRRVQRFARARPPRGSEVQHAQSIVDAFALELRHLRTARLGDRRSRSQCARVRPPHRPGTSA